MTQVVTVLASEPGRAKVVYSRPTACHMDCDHCAGGCGSMTAKETLVVWADDPVGVKPGDRVKIEARAAEVYSAVLLVYAVPIVLFFLGYALGRLWNLGAAIGILGFVLGLVVAVLVSRRKTRTGDEIRFVVTGVANPDIS